MTKNQSPSPTSGGSSGAASGSPPPENRPKPSFASMLSNPPKSHELAQKLRPLLSTASQWIVAPLGKGFFMFHFDVVEDMQRVWSLGSIHLNPGILRLIQWTPDFSPSRYKCTFHKFGFASRIWVLISGSIKLKVSRSVGDSVLLGIEYETQPTICGCCGLVGHVESKCKVQVPLEKSEEPPVLPKQGEVCPLKESVGLNAAPPIPSAAPPPFFPALVAASSSCDSFPLGFVVRKPVLRLCEEPPLLHNDASCVLVPVPVTSAPLLESS
ncbi:hypothetical protein M0R45_008854 [Rubus argutus]|uniref:DUF4283 domain-containing protein n=1 Tax=Rubus argutus TaxID=59490 RepID=A0AAW1Y4A9_RUBAR